MRLLGWILLFAACAEPPRVAETVEWVRILDNPFEGCQLDEEEYRYWFTRIVDAQTGEPVEGATLFGVDEHDFGMKALPAVDRSARSDEFGLVRFPVDRARDEWAYVTAPGYAPYAEMREPEFPVELVRGVDVEVRLLDPLGRPVAGGVVQYYLGCGHTPNSREAATDENGVAVLRCIDPDEGILFPVGPRIGGEDIEWMRLHDGVCTIHGSPGGIVEGVVLEENGAPVAGAYVGATTWNHGPWTRTGSDGRFRLMSVERFDDLDVYRNFGDRKPVAHRTAPPEGVPLRIRLGTRPETHKIEIHVTNADDPDEPTYTTQVLAWRAADGYTVSTSVSRSGWVWLDLPDGEWKLRIGGTLGPFRDEERTIDAATAAREPLEIALRLRPEVPVGLPDLGFDWTVSIASATEERYLSEEEQERGRLRIPRDRELALRVVEVGAWRSGFPGSLVRVAPGAWPEGGVRLPAPPPGDARSSLLKEATSFVRVLDPQGMPIEFASVLSRYPNGASMSETDEQGECPAGPAGTRLTVRLTDAQREWAVLRKRLSGEGPWTMQFGSASVLLEVRDEQGRPLAWYGVRPDGESVEGMEGDEELLGLDGGVHRILVAADDHKAWMQQFELRPGERRVLRVVLPAATR